MTGKSLALFSRLFRLLAFATAIALLSPFSGHSQIPLDSLHGAICGMVNPDTKAQTAISPVFTRVNMVVTDAIAQAVVTQTFVNPFRAKAEVVYLFPLPDQGAVHGMQYRYHDLLYVAKILEKQAAQAKYDSLKQAGGQAALLIQERPNIFMQRLASLGPGETASVEIRLSMPLKYADGELELAFPTRIGPRFQSGPLPNGVSGPAAATESPWNPPADRPGPEFEFNVVVQSGVELAGIQSPSHPVEVGSLADMRKTLEARGAISADDKTFMPFARAVVLKAQTTYPNRDFVLRLKRGALAPDFSVALSTDTKGRDFFMLNLYPDPTLFAGKRGDMDLVILVDISGSQMGWPLEREKEIALNILSRLNPGDNIDVLAFSDQVTYAFGNETPLPATPANLAKAETFIRGLSTLGGTQLLDAVNASLAVPANRDKRRYYVFLTDGFITNEAAVLDAIAKHPSQPTVFTFGAGNNLNRYFLEECAKVGNGFATPVLQNDAAGALVEAAWQRIESPQLENITVDFQGVSTSELLYPVSNRLYRGLPYRVAGMFSGNGPHTVTFSGTKDGVPVTITHTVNFGADRPVGWAVPKLWAREKIGQLSLAQGTTAANKDAIIRISQDYQVLSQYTAFLAAEPLTLQGDPINASTVLAENARLASDFDLAVRGSMLYVDWKRPADLISIRVYDLFGKLLFTYRPGSNASGLARWLWDGRTSSGRLLGRGRYFISVEAKSGTRSRIFVWAPAS